MTLAFHDLTAGDPVGIDAVAALPDGWEAMSWEELDAALDLELDISAALSLEDDPADVAGKEWCDDIPW